jgi:two-component system nitrogen regulation response regulator GlnG/two-component system response regulator HydG
MVTRSGRTADTETRDGPARNRPRRERVVPDGLALAIVWSAGEPHRIGEVLLPSTDRGVAWTIGRGAHDKAGARPLLPVRQRPGRTQKAPPLEDPCLSRIHLIVKVGSDSLDVECVGRRPMSIGGAHAATGTVHEGDVLEIEGVVSFACVRRPDPLPLMRHGAPDPQHAFGDPDAHGIVGESPGAWALRDAIAFAARRPAHVLLLGETGSGKELVARALHALSPRAGRKLVARNAATLPPGLVDAELFGNAPNYPHAGMPERLGLVGEADGGTLFLDEIGDLAQESQTHLLRVLDEEGEYHRLGDARRRRADVRVVCATNRPAADLKPDLAARLRLQVAVPALASRREDVPLLVRHLLSSMSSGEPLRVAQDLITALVRRTYPGNVRELEALLWKAIEGSEPGEVHLTEELRSAPGSPEGSSPPPPRLPTESDVRAALASSDWVQARAWKELGLPSRFALRRLMQRYGIRSPDE